VKAGHLRVNVIKNLGPSGRRFYDGLTPQLSKNCMVMNFLKESRKEDMYRELKTI
jgi:hypothetical protein